ncbi:MAG: DUF4065 domain-containing protein [Caulobacter sp.]
MDFQPHDARAVANLLLDRAEEHGAPISNLALQKLLYFAHGVFLVRHKQPMITGHFVAWQHGPVHPTVYETFKSAGAKPITFRATRRDYRMRTEFALQTPDDPEVNQVVGDVVRNLAKLPASRLVDMSHVEGGPWHAVVNEIRTGEGLGLRIRDSVVLARFRRHWLAVNSEADPGGPLEDAPFA